jgi:hypothetical protein
MKMVFYLLIIVLWEESTKITGGLVETPILKKHLVKSI